MTSLPEPTGSCVGTGSLPSTIEARRMPAIQIHLGTMTFGWGQASEKVDERVAGEFVTAFTAAGHKTIDCARICKTAPPSIPPRTVT